MSYFRPDISWNWVRWVPHDTQTRRTVSSAIFISRLTILTIAYVYLKLNSCRGRQLNLKVSQGCLQVGPWAVMLLGSLVGGPIGIGLVSGSVSIWMVALVVIWCCGLRT